MKDIIRERTLSTRQQTTQYTESIRCSWWSIIYLCQIKNEKESQVKFRSGSWRSTVWLTHHFNLLQYHGAMWSDNKIGRVLLSCLYNNLIFLKLWPPWLDDKNLFILTPFPHHLWQWLQIITSQFRACRRRTTLTFGWSKQAHLLTRLASSITDEQAKRGDQLWHPFQPG